MKILFLLGFIIFNSLSLGECFNPSPKVNFKNEKVITGAEQTEFYLDLLRDKRVGILANQTTIIKNRHLVDSLISLGINIVKVFGPEHGFRGNAPAGDVVDDEYDQKTGVKIISLYGKKRKPSSEDLSDLDIMIFDIQDVGCRFYTYINVLRDIMEACAENKKPLLILDRPNPNAYLVDGPVLDMKLKSGIGQFPVPISHGMTIGEFAQMINGEKWLPYELQCDLKIIKIKNYTHDTDYSVPVKPSPNLNTQQSIILYPSTCLFEGTYLNHGRGTQFPFTVIGSPKLKGKYDFSYVPVSIPGMSTSPIFMNEECFGLDLRKTDLKNLSKNRKINLAWMIELYNAYPDKEEFFDRSKSNQMGNIDNLTGTSDFKEQIKAGKSETEIRASWEPKLSEYKKMRKKYLIYP